jgi:hypothetical protein
MRIVPCVTIIAGVTATILAPGCTSSKDCCAAKSEPTSLAVIASEKSGKTWVSKFPDTKDVKDLEDDFEAKVNDFIGAVKTAGVTPSIITVYRPEERAFLMHWCWMIYKKHEPADKITDTMKGVDIDWWHGDQAKSEAAAKEMHDGYGIKADLTVEPAKTSRHTEYKAIDMSITWTGDLKIKNKDGSEVKITSTPRDSSNADLITVAKTYGVIHFTKAAKDVNHWSTDGK